MPHDFTEMNNPKFLFRAALHHPFPDWVASEAMPVKADFVEKAAAAFADPERRLFPICSPTAAFHSALNMFAEPDSLNVRACERIKQACADYGIEGDILPYAELFVAEIEKSASTVTEGRFAIDDELGGERFQLLPLNDAEDVNASAFELAKMAADNRIPFLLLIPAAREVVKAAADHGATKLPEIVTRYGKPRFPDAELAAKRIQGREQLCKDASVRPILAVDYQAALEGLVDAPDAAMEKIAAIDHAAGLTPSYKTAARVPTPYDIVYGGPLEEEVEKVASTRVLVRDVLVPLSEMQRIDARDAEFRLSKSAAEDFSRLSLGDDARELSLAVANWDEEDQRTLLRLAVDAAA